ncbi:MAG TPA: hypothetical protein P5186_06455 [Candidatus Paceibacterota bacterium]|nr:hypothetical protein [Candidatus Paceibacterota bacterium]HSA03358.1 hypothetical protein [Candidatus Paceibacterota bacterium]
MLHPPAELRLDAAGLPYLKVWEPGTHTVFDTRGRSRKIEVASLPDPWALEGAWSVHFPRGWGAPSHKVFDQLISWTDAAEDGIRHFSGRAVYRKIFELPLELLEAGSSVELDLGVVQHVARVTLNGRNLGVLWKPPYLLDVTGVAVPGRNELVVEVANTWANRIAGDAYLPPDQQYCRSNILRTRAVKGLRLQPSGLIGPVRILQGRNLRLYPRETQATKSGHAIQ